jgi:hypothetical protein
MILLASYIILIVLLGSAGDGLNNRGVQTWGHLLKALEIATLLWLPYIFSLSEINQGLAITASYICLRISLFDYIRNLTAGQPLFYMGGRNWWDMLLAKLQPSGLLFARLIFLTAGLWVIYKYL